MSGDGLAVSGGAGGVAARLSDLRATAARLDDTAGDLLRLAGRLAGIAASGALLTSAPFSPPTGARVQVALLRATAGPGGLGLLSARLDGSALLLRTRARLLQAADSGVDLLETGARRGTARLLGAAAPWAAVPLAGAATAVAVGGYGVELADEVVDLLRDVGGQRVAWSDLDDRVRALAGDAADDLLRHALQAVDAGDLPERASRLLVEHPGLTDAVTGGLPDALVGAAGAAGPLLPQDLEDAVAALLAIGKSRGLFEDRPLRVTEDRTPAADTATLAPTSVRDLFLSQQQLMEGTRHDAGASAVRLRRVDGPDGPLWVVQLPGTQQWDPVSGLDPSDVTSNLELMDDGQAELVQGVLRAMELAQVGATDRVLLTGHSQGGIAAMAMACDPAVRARFGGIEQVVTAGSPVGRFTPPGGVRVLSLEHRSDPVPRLDGRDNPDAVGWTTVRRDALHDVVSAYPPGSAEPMQPITHHAGERYTETAALVDQSDDPSLVAVREALQPFLTGTGSTRDYVLTRPPLKD